MFKYKDCTLIRVGNFSLSPKKIDDIFAQVNFNRSSDYRQGTKIVGIEGGSISRERF